MNRSSSRDLFACLVSASALLLAGAPGSLSASAVPVRRPTVTRSARNRKSAPLREYGFSGPSGPALNREIENDEIPGKLGRASGGDPVVQRQAGARSLQSITQFEGGSDADNDSFSGRIVPPDTNGDVGPNHYVQFLNLFFTIYDRTGAPVLGPLPGNAFWAGLDTACETQNDGDPIVQYDQLADRWMVSQFAFPNYPDGPFHQCIAVSASPDPTGEYYQYDFIYDDTILNDYPKFAVWPDAYYMTANEFQSPDFEAVGAGAVAFDRTAMLAGEPATMIRFQIPQEGGVLPSDLEGTALPPAGSPNFLVTFDTDPPRLSEWRFHADFANPDVSSLDGPFDIPISPFDAPVCGNPREACVPQLDSPELLEVLGGRVMYRLGYRRFADHESLVTNFTVNAAAPGSQAAIRWCELRDPAGTPVLHQEGTYAPDAEHRFMGSIAMDAVGNIALAYNESGADIHPSLAVAGRLVGDPAGTLASEEIFLAGAGSQTDSNGRWGDYSSMSVDPTDDCTFWFTGEYYASTGGFDWHTRVASFRFPSCTTGPTGVIEGTVSDASGPIAGATVTAGDSSTMTDAGGHYSLRLPVGTYDMTASKFGHVGGAASGVAVTDGGDTVQDFPLQAAAAHLVVGVVSDASGGGWPLYARIDITAEGGFPGATLFTDPVTGYYQISLVGAAVYHFQVAAVSTGYTTLLRDVPLAAAPAGGGGSVLQNFGLTADLQACAAPGYSGALTQTFASGVMPPGWTTRSTEGADWEVSAGSDPCGEWDGNLTGGAGSFGLIQTSCEHILADAQLRTPVINLAGATSPRIEWHSDYRDLGSIADVDVSNDAGGTWTNVWRRAGVDERGPGLQSVDISNLAAGQPAVQARFHYTAFFGWWWQIDDVLIGDPGASCHAVPGGLVVGEVHDANTGGGVVGAAVTALPNDALARTIATPDDPNVGDGFYVVFGGSGSRTLEASMKHYGAEDLGVTVIPGAAVRLDFELGAGRLTASPTPFAAKVPPGQVVQQTLTLSNAGSRAAGFEISEIDAPLADASTPGFASTAARTRALSRLVPQNHGSGARLFGETSAAGLPPLPDGPAADMPTLPAGRILATYPSSLTYAWGIAWDSEANDYWLTNMLQSGGDDRIYRFLPDGTKTGDSIDEHPAISVFAADGAYNPRTHTIWQVDAVPMGSSCIFEADPATRTLTGRTICPVTGTSERGLAYDAATDTYYIGSWNDGVLKHFDANGTVLDSKFVGLNIAGLAFNATTSHLFVVTDLPYLGHDVFVFDTAHDYAPVGAFPVTDDSGAHPLINGSGMEADCDGNLWIVDQSPQLIYKVVSGEQGFCPADIPWLTLDPPAGTVPAAGGAGGSAALPITVGLDSAGLFAGLHRAQLRIGTDTPYPVPPIAVDLTVEFLDVPANEPPGAYPFEPYVYGAAGAGVMPGCDQNGYLFCPNEAASGAAGRVTRADMAAYVWKAVHGPFAPPPVYASVFTDVNPFDRNADYIQGVFDDGITAGCQAPGEPKRFCPGQNISRGQMAVFVEKAARGGDFAAPPCTGIFSDVPCPPDGAVPFGDWIELLFHDGITAGCNAAGDPPAFCPTRSIGNDQMAVFLVKAFQIPH